MAVFAKRERGLTLELGQDTVQVVWKTGKQKGGMALLHSMLALHSTQFRSGRRHDAVGWRNVSVIGTVATVRKGWGGRGMGVSTLHWQAWPGAFDGGSPCS